MKSSLIIFMFLIGIAQTLWSEEVLILRAEVTLNGNLSIEELENRLNVINTISSITLKKVIDDNKVIIDMSYDAWEILAKASWVKRIIFSPKLVKKYEEHPNFSAIILE